MEENNNIVKIENEFVMKAHYSLSAVEQKIVLYLASRIDPQKDKSFYKQVVPITHIRNILMGSVNGKWKSVYEYLDEVCDRLLNQKIKFHQPLTLKNKKKIIRGGINWFQHIIITENSKGEKSIEFVFSEMMKPFLLQLNRYVRINTIDVVRLRGKYTVRMYQVFKAERDRTREFKDLSPLKYRLVDLKEFLGIGDKYKVTKDLRRRVLDPIKKEINELSHELTLDYKYLKEGRKVVGVEFLIGDKPTTESKTPKIDPVDYVPTETEIELLTNAKYLAYKRLLAFGVREGIIYRQILPTMAAGEVAGFEDIFVGYAIEHFNRWTKQKEQKAKAGTFVKWWVENKVFSPDGDVYWKINEAVYEKKKGMDEKTRANREIAKRMPRSAFFELVTQPKNKAQEDEEAEWKRIIGDL